MILSWEFSAFPIPFQSIFVETKLKKSFNFRRGFRFQRKFNFEFFAILPENNKYNIPRFFLYLIIPHGTSFDLKCNNVYDK